MSEESSQPVFHTSQLGHSPITKSSCGYLHMFLQFHTKKTPTSCTTKPRFYYVFLKIALAFVLQNILACLPLPFKSVHFVILPSSRPQPLLTIPLLLTPFFRLFLPFPLSSTRCFHLMLLHHHSFFVSRHWMWWCDWRTRRHAHASLLVSWDYWC